MSLESDIVQSVADAKIALGDLVATFVAYTLTNSYSEVTSENTVSRIEVNVDGVFIDHDNKYFDATIISNTEYSMLLFSGNLNVNDEIVVDGVRKTIRARQVIRTPTVIHAIIIAL